MSDHDTNSDSCNYVIYKAYPTAERLVMLQDNVTKEEAESACLAFARRTALPHQAPQPRARDVYELRYTTVRHWKMVYGTQRIVQNRRLI